MPLPAWVLAAALHPEVQRAGFSALKRAGSEVTKRLGRAPAVDENETSTSQDDGVPLREALEALPTRVELAEAIAAIDSQSEQRFVSLRLLLIFGFVVQAGILGLFAWFS